MTIDIIFKIAGIGILTSVINHILEKSGKKEIADLVTLASVVIVLMLIINMISGLFDTVKSIFFLA